MTAFSNKKKTHPPNDRDTKSLGQLPFKKKNKEQKKHIPIKMRSVEVWSGKTCLFPGPLVRSTRRIVDSLNGFKPTL